MRGHRWSVSDLVARGKLPAAKAKEFLPGRKQVAGRDFEERAQIFVIEQFAMRHPDLQGLLIHIPNGGSRANKFEGWRLKMMGARAGVSDMWLLAGRGGYAGLLIELKSEPPLDARVSENQYAFLADAARCGYATRICRGAGAALETLDEYLSMTPNPVQHSESWSTAGDRDLERYRKKEDPQPLRRRKASPT